MRMKARQTWQTGLALATVLSALPLQAADPKEAAEVLFVYRIQPLFKEKCLACHGDDVKKIKGDLDMRSLSAVLKGGESEKPSVVPGKPETSPLYLAATRLHEDTWSPMLESSSIVMRSVARWRKSLFLSPNAKSRGRPRAICA